MVPRGLSVYKEATQCGWQVLPKAAAFVSGWAGYEQKSVEKMVTGNMYWKAEQPREKYGWREMRIR